MKKNNELSGQYTWEERLRFYTNGMDQEQIIQLAQFIKYKHWEKIETDFNKIITDIKKTPI